MKFVLVLSGLVLLFARAGFAQDLVIGGGYADYSSSAGADDTFLAVEIHARPFYQSGKFSANLAGAASRHRAGDVFVGIGVAAVYNVNARWFAEASVMPGYYRESTPANKLGSAFEIRSLAGIGITLNSGDKVSLAFTHKSNASTSSFNPGLNSLMLRYRKRF